MDAIKRIDPARKETGRKTNRVDLFRSDGVSAQLEIDGQVHTVSVSDLSAFGCKLVVPRRDLSFETKDPVRITLDLPPNKKVVYCAQVRWSRPIDDSFSHLGLGFSEQLAPQPSFVLLNQIQPFEIPPFFSITIAFHKPYLFFERAMGRVAAISNSIWTLYADSRRR